VTIKGGEMKHIAPKISGIVFVLFTFISFCTQAQAVDLPKTAKLVPPGTILLVDIDDFSQLKQQCEKTSIYKLYKDPAMSAVVEDFKTKRRERIRKIENDFFRTIVDIDVLPQGRVAGGLVLDDQTKDANETPFLVISQWGENLTKIKEVVDKMVEKAIEDGAHRTTEDYRGVKITAIMLKSAEALHYCFIDDCFIVSVNPDVLKFVIAHIQGAASPTLADDADYTATMRNVGPYHDIDLYVNIKQIIKIEVAEDTTGQMKTMATNLGLDNVTSLGVAFGLARGDGSSSITKALLKINGPKKGVVKMLDIETAAVAVPQFIPASAYSLTQINLDIKKAYDELYNTLLSFSPQYAAITHIPILPAGPQGEPGLQLKSDIIAHFGSQIAIARSIDKQASDDLPPTERLVAVAVNNRSALEKSLTLLYNKLILPKDPDARRQLLGHTMYLVDLSAFMPALKRGQKTPMTDRLEERLTMDDGRRMIKAFLSSLVPPPARGQACPRESGDPSSLGQPTLDEPTSEETQSLAFTVTDAYLIFGNESNVERAIRALSSTGTASIASAKWFTAAKACVPSVVGLAGFQDSATLGEVFWKKLKKDAEKAEVKDKDSGIELKLGIDSKSPFPYLEVSPVNKLFDGDLLPKFDTVRKYFGLSAYYGVSRPDGFFFELHYINPPEGG